MKVLPRGRPQHGSARAGMNRTEEDYAAYLELQRRNDRISGWKFGDIKFRLANKTWYLPDFFVMGLDGSLEIHEVKGHMEDDSAVKIKTTSALYSWFPVKLVKQIKGGWEIKDVSGGL